MFLFFCFLLGGGCKGGGQIRRDREMRGTEVHDMKLKDLKKRETNLEQKTCKDNSENTTS